MEKDKQLFGRYLYSSLIRNKLNKLNDLEKLFEEQNKEVLDRLKKENIIDSRGVPTGLVLEPKTQEEVNQSQLAITNYANKYKEYGGKSDVLVNITDHIKDLIITEEEVLNCIVTE